MQGKKHIQIGIAVALIIALLSGVSSLELMRLEGEFEVGKALSIEVNGGDLLQISGPGGDYSILLNTPETVPFVPNEEGEYTFTLYFDEDAVGSKTAVIRSQKAELALEKGTYLIGDTVRVFFLNAPEAVSMTLTYPSGQQIEFFSHNSLVFEATEAGVYRVEVEGQEKEILVHSTLAQFSIIDHTQGEVILGSPVTWKKVISVSREGILQNTLPAASSNIRIVRDGVTLSPNSFTINGLHSPPLARGVPRSLEWHGEIGTYTIFYDTPPVSVRRNQQGDDIVFSVESEVPYRNIPLKYSLSPTPKRQISVYKLFEDIEYDLSRSQEFSLQFFFQYQWNG